MPNQPAPPIRDWPAFRKRIEYEDGLLNSRVNVLLVTNGLGASAIGLTGTTAAKLVIAIFILIINLLLFLSTFQTALMIRQLTSEYIRGVPDPIDFRVRDALSWLPRPLRSTFILGIWTPLVIIFGWLVGITMIIISVV